MGQNRMGHYQRIAEKGWGLKIEFSKEEAAWKS